MEVEVIEAKEKCELVLKITISKEEVNREIERKYRELGLTARVAGFRKGKVPRKILENRYGQLVEKEALETLISNGYKQVIKEKNIPVVSQPEIEEVKYIRKDEPVSFSARVEVKPQIEVNNYKGIPLKKKVTKITDKDVENALRRLQEKYTPIEVVDKPIGKNSIVIFDFESFKDGTPIPNGSQKNILLEMGKNFFPPEFERQLLKLKKGDEKEFKIKLPKDYSEPSMAGQKITFKVRINEVKERATPPALNDEFAKDVGEFNTLKELKEALRKDLIKAAEFDAKRKLKEEIITILSAQHSFPLPRTLVEKEINYILVNLEVTLHLQGKTLEDYLNMKNMTIDACREEFRPQAIENLKRFLILDSIAKKENIDVSDEEYEAWVKNNFRGEPAKIKKYLEDNLQSANLKQELRIEKTLDFLVEVADIK